MDDQTVVLDGQRFRVRVVASPRRRSIAIVMEETGTILVRVPPTWQGTLMSVLDEARPWIHRQQLRLSEVDDEKPVISLGGFGYVLGEKRIISREWPGGVAEGTALRARLEAWYQEAGAPYLASRLQLWSRTLRIAYRGFRLSHATGRWGYCRADGWIGLNWRLYQAPLFVIDYVVVHELVHRQFPHHQRSFWAQVRLCYPEADRARDWLKRHGRTLIW